LCARENTDTHTRVLCDVQAWWLPVRTAETCSDTKYSGNDMQDVTRTVQWIPQHKNLFGPQWSQTKQKFCISTSNLVNCLKSSVSMLTIVWMNLTKYSLKQWKLRFINISVYYRNCIKTLCICVRCNSAWNVSDYQVSLNFPLCIYKVVQIWPGRFVCKQVTVCPGYIWTTLYFMQFWNRHCVR
jgi:hypothetical protein